MEKRNTHKESERKVDGKSTEPKVLEVFGYRIESNNCKAVDYSLYVKKFGEYVQSTGKEHGFKLSMNHIKVWELIEESTSITLKEEADTDQKWLVLETKDFVISIKIPQEVQDDN